MPMKTIALISLLFALTQNAWASSADGPRFRIPVTGEHARKGPANAKVTVVFFGDFQCPFSARVQPTLSALEQHYDNRVQWVFVHNPLPFHNRAQAATRAAIAAQRQGKFWQMSEKLFVNSQRLEDDDFRTYARELKLDMRRFEADLKSRATERQLEADLELAKGLGVTGTPTFFINGLQRIGAISFEDFVTLLDQDLARTEPIVYTEPRPTQPPLDEPRVALPLEKHHPRKGSPQAKVTVVMMGDFQCPFTARSQKKIAELERHYGKKLQLVFIHNPLPFHPRARPAAMAALAAHEQGKFWQMTEKLFANPTQLEDEDLLRYAGELGLNEDRFQANLRSAVLVERLKRDQALAEKFAGNGTPVFFINGYRLVGDQPTLAFERIIDQELARWADERITSGPTSARQSQAWGRCGTEAPSSRCLGACTRGRRPPA